MSRNAEGSAVGSEQAQFVALSQNSFQRGYTYLPTVYSLLGPVKLLCS